MSTFCDFVNASVKPAYLTGKDVLVYGDMHDMHYLLAAAHSPNSYVGTTDLPTTARADLVIALEAITVNNLSALLALSIGVRTGGWLILNVSTSPDVMRKLLSALGMDVIRCESGAFAVGKKMRRPNLEALVAIT